MQEINFVDLKSQYLAYKDEIDKEVLSVLASGEYICGGQLAGLEKELRDYCRDSELRAVGCSNGTDALLLALLAAGVKAGDEVMTPSFTFVSTVEVVCLIGAVPVFVDIDFDSALIDEESIAASITEKCKAIIPVSLFGQMANLEKINKIAEEHSICVIEDAAQSFGASRDKNFSCAVSDYACTSFYPAKGLGCYGDGGAVFTKDEEKEAVLRSLLNHGQSTRYEYVKIGINGRLDEIQAAILRVKLRHYAKEVARRRELAKEYDEALASHPHLQPLKILQNNKSVYSQYSLYAPPDKRDKYRDILKEQGIPTAVYYPKPLHQHQVFHQYMEEAKVPIPSLPKTEEAATRIFSLPVQPFLSDEEQDKILLALANLD